MKLALWLFLTVLRWLGCRIVGLTIDGRTAYDRARVATGGELEKSTDGLSFKWKGCRVGYEPAPEDFAKEEPDGVLCRWCAEPWHHSLTRIDSKGRKVPDRDPSERCETCARKTAERRGVPWETVR